MKKPKPFELGYCSKCIQMTNHLNGWCQKCKIRKISSKSEVEYQQLLKSTKLVVSDSIAKEARASVKLDGQTQCEDSAGTKDCDSDVSRNETQCVNPEPSKHPCCRESLSCSGMLLQAADGGKPICVNCMGMIYEMGRIANQMKEATPGVNPSTDATALCVRDDPKHIRVEDGESGAKSDGFEEWYADIYGTPPMTACEIDIFNIAREAWRVSRLALEKDDQPRKNQPSNSNQEIHVEEPAARNSRLKTVKRIEDMAGQFHVFQIGILDEILAAHDAQVEKRARLDEAKNMRELLNQKTGLSSWFEWAREIANKRIKELEKEIGE